MESVISDDEIAISIRSNYDTDGWKMAIEKFKANKEEPVIFVDNNFFNVDENEIDYGFTALTVAQAEFLIENLKKVVDKIKENPSK